MSSYFDPDQAAYYKADPRHGIDQQYQAISGRSRDNSLDEPGFFFYDLETSGINPREDRIMQFAGQRTNLDLEPIGEPIDILIRLSNDTLPSPDAIMVTGILPQNTLEGGLSEAEFCRFVSEKVFTPNTIACGYNSVRFDDEHMRYLFWRNFYDPYEWQWKDNRSRWDLLDVVRMVRALRPEEIEWPTKVEPETQKIRPANNLELLSKINHIEHTRAHDALSDVEALIAIARLVLKRQPQIFNYLLKMRDKRQVRELVNLENPQPFVYTSGKYSSDFLNTSVAYPITQGRNGNIVVFNLRYNLEELLDKERNFQPETKKNRLGEEYTTWFDFSDAIKELAPNKCPAVAPLSVLDARSKKDSSDPFAPHKRGTSGWEKIQLNPEMIQQNLEILLQHPDFIEKMSGEFISSKSYPPTTEVEARLYDGFLDDGDRRSCQKIRRANLDELADLSPVFNDERLPKLFLHYKARNFIDSMSSEEQSAWEQDRRERIKRQRDSFWAALTMLEELSRNNQVTPSGREVRPEIIIKLKEWYDFCNKKDS